jgi:hypothetical protein
MIRSILSVLAGTTTWGVLWVASNAALAAALPGSFDEHGVTSNGGLLLLILAYSIVLSVLAGWLTATIARTKPTGHALALGIVQLAFGIAAQSAYWSLMPLWYHLPFLALLIPGNLLGAHLRGPRMSVQPA